MSRKNFFYQLKYGALVGLSLLCIGVSLIGAPSSASAEVIVEQLDSTTVETTTNSPFSQSLGTGLVGTAYSASFFLKSVDSVDAGLANTQLRLYECTDGTYGTCDLVASSATVEVPVAPHIQNFIFTSSYVLVSSKYYFLNLYAGNQVSVSQYFDPYGCVATCYANGSLFSGATVLADIYFVLFDDGSTIRYLSSITVLDPDLYEVTPTTSVNFRSLYTLYSYDSPATLFLRVQDVSSGLFLTSTTTSLTSSSNASVGAYEWNVLMTLVSGHRYRVQTSLLGPLGVLIANSAPVDFSVVSSSSGVSGFWAISSSTQFSSATSTTLKTFCNYTGNGTWFDVLSFMQTICLLFVPNDTGFSQLIEGPAGVLVETAPLSLVGELPQLFSSFENGFDVGSASASSTLMVLPFGNAIGWMAQATTVEVSLDDVADLPIVIYVRAGMTWIMYSVIAMATFMSLKSFI